MYTGGKRRLYLELPSWLYLPLPPHSQKVVQKLRYIFVLRNVLIFFNMSRCHNSCNAEGYSRNRGRCNGSCRRKSPFCHTHAFICSNFMIIQLGILAHAFPPSRARTLAFATFSAGQALGAVFGSNVAGVLTEFTPCDLFRSSLFRPITLICFDLEILGVPRSTYYLDWPSSSLLVVCFR